MHEASQTEPPPGKESTLPPTVKQDPSETNATRTRRRPRTGFGQRRVKFLTSLVVVVGLWYLVAQCSSYISGLRRGRFRRLAEGGEKWLNLPEICGTAASGGAAGPTANDADESESGASGAAAPSSSSGAKQQVFGPDDEEAISELTEALDQTSCVEGTGDGSGSEDEGAAGGSAAGPVYPEVVLPEGLRCYYEFPQLLPAEQNRDGILELHRALNFMAGLRSSINLQRLAIFRLEFMGVKLKIVVEEKKRLAGWPSNCDVRKAGGLLERAVLKATSEAINKPETRPVKTAGIRVTKKGKSVGHIGIMVIAFNKSHTPDSDEEEVEVFV